MKRKKAKPEVKLDISDNLQPAEKGFRRARVKDLEKIAPNSVDEILMNGCLEQRSGDSRINLMRFVYKALKPGGKAHLTCAYGFTNEAVMNPFSQWPPLVRESFGYFSKDVRKASNYSNPALDDINFEVAISDYWAKDWDSRPDPVKFFAASCYNNVIKALSVILTKKGA